MHDCLKKLQVKGFYVGSEKRNRFVACAADGVWPWDWSLGLPDSEFAGFAELWSSFSGLCHVPGSSSGL